MDQASLIILYDGHCALCHRSVYWLNALDREGLLSFAPLTPQWSEAHPGGVILWTPNGVFYAADAVVIALQHTRPWGPLLATMVRFTPGYKKIYRWVATHRYRIFGLTDKDLTSCPRPRSWRGRPLRFSQTPPLPPR
jgi:predicted DCC family thiol-disulfide oxidoreductase YuxK